MESRTLYLLGSALRRRDGGTSTPGFCMAARAVGQRYSAQLRKPAGTSLREAGKKLR
jgi:hypothetical protein